MCHVTEVFYLKMPTVSALWSFNTLGGGGGGGGGGRVVLSIYDIERMCVPNNSLFLALPGIR